MTAKVGETAANDEAGALKDWDFQSLFLAPALTALTAAVFLLLFFHPPLGKTPEPAY
jgi:hypothetical protein